MYIFAITSYNRCVELQQQYALLFMFLKINHIYFKTMVNEAGLAAALKIIGEAIDWVKPSPKEL